MKKLFLVAITVFSALIVLGQEKQNKEKELSNAELFSAKAGTLIQKEYSEIGTVKKAKIMVVYYTDLINTTKISALKLESEIMGKYSSSTKMAILDKDEIDGLIKSIKLIQEKIFPLTPTNYTEVSYKSRGGFEAGCFWGKNSWSTYLKLEKHDSDSYVFFNKDDFPLLLSLLEQANTKL